MAQLLSNCSSRGTSGFQKVVRAFLSGTGLPFAEVLSAERIERVFRKHRWIRKGDVPPTNSRWKPTNRAVTVFIAAFHSCAALQAEGLTANSPG